MKWMHHYVVSSILRESNAYLSMSNAAWYMATYDKAYKSQINILEAMLTGLAYGLFMLCFISGLVDTKYS